MEKKQLAVVVAVVGVFCSAALAGAPLGPPRSLVDHGQWAINFEYAHEEMDLYTYGTWETRSRSYSEGEWGSWGDWYCSSGVIEVRNLEADMWFGSLEYGLCDRWEVFIRLGIADAQDEMEPVECGVYDVDEIYNFDGDYGFAWGAGTKMTICQIGDWTFGAVIQMTFLYPDESDLTWGYEQEGAVGVIEGEGDLDLRQFQAGLGATLDLDTWFVYGGICWLYVRGDMDVDLTDTLSVDDTPFSQAQYVAEHDVAEQSDVGAWFGLGCQLDTAVAFAEAQILEDYWLIGGGVKIPLP